MRILGESDLYTEHPALMLVSACLKYPPVRDAFDAAAKQELAARGAGGGLGGHGVPKGPGALSVPMLLKILEATCSALEDVRMDVWTVNTGRARQSGFLPWMKRWCVLDKVVAGVRLQHAKCVRLGQGGMLYRIVPLSDEAQAALGSVLRSHTVARAMQLRPSRSRLNLPREPREPRVWWWRWVSAHVCTCLRRSLAFACVQAWRTCMLSWSHVRESVRMHLHEHACM